VIDAGWQGGYGRAVRIAHRDGSTTLYAHLSAIDVPRASRSRGRGDRHGRLNRPRDRAASPFRMAARRVDRQKALEAALAQIDRAFGKGSAMKLGSREKIEIETVSTGSSGSTSRLASAACRAAG
jgi:hypothetical protein